MDTCTIFMVIIIFLIVGICYFYIHEYLMKKKKKTWYKIMFRLIEQVFIAALSFSGSLARMSLIS